MCIRDSNDIDYPTLQRAQMIIVGTPVYYGKLDEDIVHFINNHQELLISKHYCLYVTGILQSEFMTFVTQAFSCLLYTSSWLSYL